VVEDTRSGEREDTRRVEGEDTEDIVVAEDKDLAGEGKKQAEKQEPQLGPL